MGIVVDNLPFLVPSSSVTSAAMRAEKRTADQSPARKSFDGYKRLGRRLGLVTLKTYEHTWK